MNEDEVVVDEQELNPNDPEARAVRERAVEYADRIANGEEPWADEEGGASPKDDYVGEDGGTDEEPVPVPESIENAPALDEDDPVQVGDVD